MTTAQLISRPQGQSVGLSPDVASATAVALELARPTIGELVDEVFPATDVVVAAGPPVVFLAGFGVVVTLMVCAPLMILLTIVAIGLAAVATVVAVGGAAVLGPYLLVRRLGSALGQRP